MCCLTSMLYCLYYAMSTVSLCRAVLLSVVKLVRKRKKLHAAMSTDLQQSPTGSDDVAPVQMESDVLVPTPVEDEHSQHVSPVCGLSCAAFGHGRLTSTHVSYLGRTPGSATGALLSPFHGFGHLIDHFLSIPLCDLLADRDWLCHHNVVCNEVHCG